jgi:hypothetical protein
VSAARILRALLTVTTLACLARAAAADAIARSFTVVNFGPAGTTNAQPLSREATTVNFGVAPNLVGQALSRASTSVNFGIAPNLVGQPIARASTTVNFGVVGPVSNRAISRAFTVSKDGGTAGVDPPTPPPVALVFAFHGAEPNPARGVASIAYELAEARPVRLEVYDITRQRVRVLASLPLQPAGPHVVTWDGRDEDGNPVAAGLYMLRLRAGSFDRTRRVALLRD